MRRLRSIRPALLLGVLAAASGCGNKMALPEEQDRGEIPFSGYFVYGTWENVGRVTDILVTENQWLYLAEDSAAVSRYKRKGANENGKLVARVVEVMGGLERPLYLDEGAEDHLLILDLIGEEVPIPPDSIESRTLYQPTVRLYDLFSETFAAAWTDTAWAPIDSFHRFPGRDSTKSTRTLREVVVTGIEADASDNVFVAGRSLRYREKVERFYDTTSTTPIGADTTYADTLTGWFVRSYDSGGAFLAETAGDGTGLGYGREITDAALSPSYLFFVDAGTDRVKINEVGGESAGVDWLDGSEISAGTEAKPFVLDPAGLAVDPRGFLYVCDGGNARVLKYTAEFRYRERVDRNGPGLLAAPSAIAATDSLVYVFDEAGPKIVLFELPKAEE
jgi:hypothetical protein